MTRLKIANLLTLYLFGEKIESIGAHYGVHHSTVSRIVKRHYLRLRGKRGQSSCNYVATSAPGPLASRASTHTDTPSVVPSVGTAGLRTSQREFVL